MDHMARRRIWGAAMALPIIGLSFFSSCTSPAPDQHTQVRTQVEATMNAFAAMDLDAFMHGMAAEVTAYEFDMDGTPLRLGSRDEVKGFATGVFDAMRNMDAKLSITFDRVDVQVDGDLAACAVEFDSDARMPDGAVTSQPTRNTVVLHRDADGWKWTHWQSSAAVAAPATEPPAGPDA